MRLSQGQSELPGSHPDSLYIFWPFLLDESRSINFRVSGMIIWCNIFIFFLNLELIIAFQTMPFQSSCRFYCQWAHGGLLGIRSSGHSVSWKMVYSDVLSTLVWPDLSCLTVLGFRSLCCQSGSQHQEIVSFLIWFDLDLLTAHSSQLGYCCSSGNNDTRYVRFTSPCQIFNQRKSVLWPRPSNLSIFIHHSMGISYFPLDVYRCNRHQRVSDSTTRWSQSSHCAFGRPPHVWGWCIHESLVSGNFFLFLLLLLLFFFFLFFWKWGLVDKRFFLLNFWICVLFS